MALRCICKGMEGGRKMAPRTTVNILKQGAVVNESLESLFWEGFKVVSKGHSWVSKLWRWPVALAPGLYTLPHHRMVSKWSPWSSGSGHWLGTGVGPLKAAMAGTLELWTWPAKRALFELGA